MSENSRFFYTSWMFGIPLRANILISKRDFAKLRKCTHSCVAEQKQTFVPHERYVGNIKRCEHFVQVLMSLKSTKINPLQSFFDLIPKKLTIGRISEARSVIKPSVYVYGSFSIETAKKRLIEMNLKSLRVCLPQIDKLESRLWLPKQFIFNCYRSWTNILQA